MLITEGRKLALFIFRFHHSRFPWTSEKCIPMHRISASSFRFCSRRCWLNMTICCSTFQTVNQNTLYYWVICLFFFNFFLFSDFLRTLAIIRLKNPSRGVKRSNNETTKKKNTLDGIVDIVEVRTRLTVITLIFNS